MKISSIISISSIYLPLYVSQHLSDLCFVTRIIERIAQRVENYHEYIPLFKKFLKICAIPPLIHNSSELLTEMANFEEYISVLGKYIYQIKKRRNFKNCC